MDNLIAKMQEYGDYNIYIPGAGSDPQEPFTRIWMPPCKSCQQLRPGIALGIV